LEVRLPSRAQVVVIGGGVIGASTAYHLSKLGRRDVVLIERHRLTAGTTWHAAGLITSAGMPDEASMFMSTYSRDLYARLEDETGLSTGFRRTGHIHLATTPERVEALRRERNYALGFGEDSVELSPREVQQLWPLAEVGDVLCGLYAPQDGRANPVDVAMSLARGARNGGVTIVEGVAVTGVRRRGDQVVGVDTDRGPVDAEVVVNCAGMWGRQVGAMAGVTVPLQAAEHYYIVTEPFDGVDRDLPAMEDPDAYGYYREEVGGLLVGLFEPEGAAWQVEGVPDDFAFGELTPDYDRLAPYVDRAMARIPALRDVGISKFFCGPESFTPDVRPMLGESPELRGFFTACGLNSLGILLGGGVGYVMADWIVSGHPPLDLSGFTVDRAQPFETTPKFRRERTVEQLGVLFGDAVVPGWSPRYGRNIRRSPVHDRLCRHGAHFGTSSGWEWAEYFAPDGWTPSGPHRGWGRRAEFELVAAEHRAVREAVGLLDMSFMCKFVVQGRHAERVLDRLVVSDARMPIGRVRYTAILNAAAGMEVDCTVTRVADERFMVIGTDTVQRRLDALLRRAITDDDHAAVTDVTSGLALFSLQGPHARRLLERVSGADFSNDSFAYLTGQPIDVDYAPVWAQRVTYVGELGWELHVSTELALTVYDALFAAGADLGLRDIGMHALDGLRLEKGYRDYGHDVGNTDTPLEAGLGFMVDWGKPAFVGRDALAGQRAAGAPARRLVSLLVLDPEPLLYEGESVLRDGEFVGDVQAGAYGHTLGGSVAIAAVHHPEGVTPAWVEKGRWEVKVADDRYPARVQLGPLYDPERRRILA
jgi:4-methylaminobutanoate oxidase (formaldehyde-forming)